MKKLSTLKKLVTGIVLACMFVVPATTLKLNAASYQIVFKAGTHGTINGQKEANYQLTSEDAFPDEPNVEAESGYVFAGWNKELPSVGSTVTGKQIYVAKYNVVVNGVNYTVRYVDENGVDITTAKTVLGEKGNDYTVRAKTVAGYTYKEATKTFTLNEENTSITFVYSLTNPNEVVRNETVFEEETVNQVVPGQTTNNGNTNAGNNTNNPNQGTQGNEQEEEIEDNEQPKGDGNEEEIEDNKQPESKGEPAGSNSMLIFGGITGAALLICGVWFLIAKRKNHAEA